MKKWLSQWFGQLPSLKATKLLEKSLLTANFSFLDFFEVKQTDMVFYFNTNPRYTIFCVGINTDVLGWGTKFKLSLIFTLSMTFNAHSL